MPKQLPLIFLVALFISSCGVTKRGTNFDNYTISNGINVKSGELIESGVASWYGPNFDGKLTANGEVYDMNGYTAAHRTLPFGTEVLVENLGNGKKVRVRVNDRGPFAKDRVIDLSKSAAQDIEMIGPGTANVKIFLAEGELRDTRIGDLTVATYTVQLASYTDQAPADKKAKTIEGSRVERLSLDGKTVYRVYYGDYTDPDDAQKALLRLESKGIDGFVKQIQND